METFEESLRQCIVYLSGNVYLLSMCTRVQRRYNNLQLLNFVMFVFHVPMKKVHGVGVIVLFFKIFSRTGVCAFV